MNIQEQSQQHVEPTNGQLSTICHNQQQEPQHQQQQRQNHQEQRKNRKRFTFIEKMLKKRSNSRAKTVRAGISILNNVFIIFFILWMFVYLFHSKGNLQIIVGGMHIGFDIWRISELNISPVISFNLLDFVMISWFLTAILGSILGGFLLERIPKQFIYYITGSILLISSLIWFLWPYKLEALIISRSIAGFSYGIVYVVLLVHASEIVAINVRDQTVSSITSYLCYGLFLVNLIYDLNVNEYEYVNESEQSSNLDNVNKFYENIDRNYSFNKLFGGVALILSIISVWEARSSTVESVVFLLEKGEEEAALRIMILLRQENVCDVEIVQRTRIDLEDLRLMIIENKLCETRNIFTRSNKRSLLLAIGIVLLTFIANNWLIMTFVYEFMSGSTCTIPLIRIIMLQILFMLRISRKRLLIISGMLTAILLAGILVYCLAEDYQYEEKLENLILFWVLLLHAIVSVGLVSLKEIWLSEAFSTRKKSWSLTLVTIFDYSLYILSILIFIIYTYFGLLFILFTAMILLVWLSTILYFEMPETIGMSLRQRNYAFNSRQ